MFCLTLLSNFHSTALPTSCYCCTKASTTVEGKALTQWEAFLFPFPAFVAASEKLRGPARSMLPACVAVVVILKLVPLRNVKAKIPSKRCVHTCDFDLSNR